MILVLSFLTFSDFYESLPPPPKKLICIKEFDAAISALIFYYITRTCVNLYI